MWNQSGGDFGNSSMAGGFFTGTPGGDTSASEKKGGAGAQRAHNVMPVTIQDIMNAPDEKLSIEGTEVHMVTFIGTLESIEPKATNITYTIRDDSGTIEVVQWVESDGNPVSHVSVMENTFVRVIGSIRQTQDRRHVMAFRVAPLKSANEVTTHLLECHWVRLKLRQVKRKSGMPVTTSNTSTAGGMAGPLASNSNNFNNTGGIQGLTTFQSMVYNIIQATTAETGIEKQQIYSSVKGKMGPRDVDAALEFLCSEGHIYSTIDEDHFKSTDS